MPLQQLLSLAQLTRGDRCGRLLKLRDRVTSAVKETYHLGFTAFGGPPSHFRIFHAKFVEDRKDGGVPWITEQTYQELFALCQALPGPASTKFLFIVALVHAGWTAATVVFLLWSLPGAIGMFGLSLGVQSISDTLPGPTYAFLSGLNASTVGIIAVAGVGLARKCIRDAVSRILVTFGACAGLCYSALWYYPVLVVMGGMVTVVWDLWLGRLVRRWRQKRELKKLREAEVRDVEARSEAAQSSSAAIEMQVHLPASTPEGSDQAIRRAKTSGQIQETTSEPSTETTRHVEQEVYGVSGRTSLVVLTGFIISFVVVMVLRAKLTAPPLALSLFANMYLAGTIIFGGGPVVIPLLREYVVTPGWVSPRDFLIGLAIIQAFPGPNFNFSVYLGVLTLAGAAGSAAIQHSIAGAVLAFVGIFAPGLLFTIFIQGIWRRLRTNPLFAALLRGINATAVGLVFTAVYRLWEVGYLTSGSTNGNSGVSGGHTVGKSLADEPFWVVVAVITYSGNEWFGVPPAVGIVIGGLLGLAWYGTTQI